MVTCCLSELPLRGPVCRLRSPWGHPKDCPRVGGAGVEAAMEHGFPPASAVLGSAPPARGQAQPSDLGTQVAGPGPSLASAPRPRDAAQLLPVIHGGRRPCQQGAVPLRMKELLGINPNKTFRSRTQSHLLCVSGPRPKRGSAACERGGGGFAGRSLVFMGPVSLP